VRTTATRLDDDRARLDVEVPPERVAHDLQHTLRHLAESVRIPGFRKGKVPPPLVLQRLGVKLEVIKSTDETDYTELIAVEAIAAGDGVHSAKGTLIGKAAKPRIVEINGREVEAEAHGKLLLLENHDEPGMIGYVGTLLGTDRVNIANMSLSRMTAGGTAIMVINLDSEPSEAARKELKAHRAIKLAKFVQL